MLKYKTVNIVFLGLFIIILFWNWRYGVSLWVVVSLIACYGAIHVWGAIFVSAQFFLPIRCHGSSSSGAISLTFDDGPIPGKTDRILSILQEHRIPAAFFCIGNRIEKNPELMNRIHLAGHVIGNHSFSHSNTFDLQSTEKMIEELESTDNAAKQILGLRPHFFRPPYGVTNPNLARAVGKGDYVTIGWSVRSFDTITQDKTKLFRRVTRKLKAGDIILFHDYCDSTIEMLPEFLAYVSKIGLKIVRVDELLGEKAYVK